MYNRDVFDQLGQGSIPVNQVTTDWLQQARIELSILRLDLLHPEISGNKWFKLKNHLLYAFRHGYTTILSFGGAWSNHIHALAAAGYHLGFPTIGVIRGERPGRLSPTLRDAERWGMRLRFVTRKEYRTKENTDFQRLLLSELDLPSNDVWIVPEGGSGELGVIGCEEILKADGIEFKSFDEIWLAAGTGATSAGVIRSAPSSSLVRSVSVLKGASWLRNDIQNYVKNEDCRWETELEYHCGGYARTTSELLMFVKDFEQETGIPLDPVYTGKAMYALYQKASARVLKPCSKVLFIHTGGLQGKREL